MNKTKQQEIVHRYGICIVNSIRVWWANPDTCLNLILNHYRARHHFKIYATMNSIVLEWKYS